MIFDNVTFQTPILSKANTAPFAHIRLFTRMNPHVNLQILPPDELFTAKIAFIHSLVRMLLQMLLQPMIIEEHVAAHFAKEVLLSHVHVPLMDHQVIRVWELLPADAASGRHNPVRLLQVVSPRIPRQYEIAIRALFIA